MKTFKLNILLLLAVLIFTSCKKEESSVVYLEGDWNVYKVETIALEDSIPDYLSLTNQEWITHYSNLIYIEDGLVGGSEKAYFIGERVFYEYEGTALPMAKKVTDTEIMIVDVKSNSNFHVVLKQNVYLKKE